MEQSDSPLRHYLQILRRQTWIIVLVPLVALAATYVHLERRPPVYRAAMTLVVGEQPRGGEFAPTLGTVALTGTLTSLLKSDHVARNVIRDLQLDTTKEKFLEKLEVEVMPETSVLDVTYETTNRDTGLAIIERLAAIFTTQLDRTLGLRGPNEPFSTSEFQLVVKVFDPPHVEPEPVERNDATLLGFAGAAALAFGLLLATARDALDSRIRDARDAEHWFNAPVVGALPRGVRGHPPPGVGPGTTRRLGRRREAQRQASLDLLRARLEYTQAGPGRKVVVTSASEGDGKSAVAASLSAALAHDGKRVVCVDADTRHPSLHRYLGFQPDSPGLADVLRAGVDLEDALVPIELGWASENGARPPRGRLEALPAGQAPARLGGPLSPQAAAGLMEILESRADYVVLDSPPLLAAEAFPLAAHSDNVLVVARHGRTTKGQAESVRTTLERLGVSRVAVVLTDAPPIATYG
ncbi:MAG TPA: P-loop NTPase [Gaiellaceae bacterium]|nr:P-loop NTPase [Gaiellaceae bacterium]